MQYRTIPALTSKPISESRTALIPSLGPGGPYRGRIEKRRGGKKRKKRETGEWRVAKKKEGKGGEGGDEKERKRGKGEAKRRGKRRERRGMKKREREEESAGWRG